MVSAGEPGAAHGQENRVLHPRRREQVARVRRPGGARAWSWERSSAGQSRSLSRPSFALFSRVILDRGARPRRPGLLEPNRHPGRHRRISSRSASDSRRTDRGTGLDAVAAGAVQKALYRLRGAPQRLSRVLEPLTIPHLLRQPRPLSERQLLRRTPLLPSPHQTAQLELRNPLARPRRCNDHLRPMEATPWRLVSAGLCPGGCGFVDGGGCLRAPLVGFGRSRRGVSRLDSATAVSIGSSTEPVEGAAPMSPRRSVQRMPVGWLPASR